jgi:uncharacterized protein
MYFLLLNDVVDDYVARRAVYRDAHLQLARAAVERGELVLGGAFDDPVDGAALVFSAADRAIVEELVRHDPYVINGLVTTWRIRPWNVVVGSHLVGKPQAPSTAS